MPKIPDSEDQTPVMPASYFEDLIAEGPLTDKERRDDLEDDYNADSYKPPSGGIRKKWAISALKSARGLGNATNQDNCLYRGALYGTSEHVKSDNPEDFVPNNPFVTLGRKMYYTLGDMRKEWIDQSLTDPKSPFQSMFKSGLENGASAILQISGQETQIGNQLIKDGHRGDLELAVLRLLRPNYKIGNSSNIINQS